MYDFPLESGLSFVANNHYHWYKCKSDGTWFWPYAAINSCGSGTYTISSKTVIKRVIFPLP